MFDWIADIIKEILSLIPKAIYLLNSSLLSLIDFLQLLFRKLAGLDVYYVTNEAGQSVATTGDLLTNFIGGILGININNSDSFGYINYSILSTVFWSFVIFGLIILFISTIVAIIKSHYSYNEKSAKGPLPIVATAGKAVINIVAVPIIVILGLYLSQAILSALDSITAVGSDDVVNLYGSENTQTYLEQGITDSQGNQTYIFYDMFGYTGEIFYGSYSSPTNPETAEALSRVAARSQPFSGAMFKVAAYNGNRVRKGQYTINTVFSGNGGGGMDLFSNHNNDADVLANMVDEAFANFLHLNQDWYLTYSSDDSGGNVAIVADRYITTFSVGHFCAYSKFNVGLVWYYYDLWDYNFIVGFGAVIVCLTLFFNVILGLMSRLFMALVLFLVMPPLAGLGPLDEGKAFKGWREQFMKQVLMAYGAVVGMNLVLMILPYVNEINFFNIAMVDILVQTLFIIVGLVTIKSVIATLSALIGAADANKTGEDASKDVRATIGRATGMTIGAAKLGAMPYAAALKGAGKGVTSFAGGVYGLVKKDADGKRIGVRAGARAANMAADKFVENRRKDVSAFLSGGVGGLRNERKMRRLEDKDIKKQTKALNEAQSNQAKAQEQEHLAQMSHIMKNQMTGNETNEEITQLFKARGFNDQEIAQMVQSASKARSGGVIDRDKMSQQLRNYNKDYDSYVRDNGGNLSRAASSYHDRTVETKAAGYKLANAKDELEASNKELADRQGRVDYYKRHPGLVGGAFRGARNVAGGVMGAAGLAAGGIFDKDTMDAFNDAMVKTGVRPKGPDWARQSAENTARTNRAVNELTNEIRQMRRDMGKS